MEGHCSTGQRPQWAVVSMEEEDKEDDRMDLIVESIILHVFKSLRLM